MTQESLRRAIGVVGQDTSLLHRSVRDNIKYGRLSASDAEMIEAAKRASVHEVIEALVDPEGRTGYDAHVGERGVKLSGGQRQRIALARVILKNAPILVLDEATSALDREVEAAIQDTLYRVMQGKTVIAIAHRLSTIAHMDRIVVLDAGQIVEEGSHAELLARAGSTPGSGAGSPAASSTWRRRSDGGWRGECRCEALLTVRPCLAHPRRFRFRRDHMIRRPLAVLLLARRHARLGRLGAGWQPDHRADQSQLQRDRHPVDGRPRARGRSATPRRSRASATHLRHRS